jgi:hypothetical protein
MRFPRLAAPGAAALAALAVLAAAPAAAQSVKQLGVFHDWAAYSAPSGTGEICFVVAKPASVTPSPDGYSQAYLYLTDRPDEKIANEFNLIAGFKLAADQPASVTVNGQTYPLFIRGDSAWLKDPAQGGNLAGSIRAGASLVVDLVSDQGVRVRESFSLSGATAASQAMSDAC